MKFLSKHPILKLLLWPFISIVLIPLSLWIASSGNKLLGESQLQFRPWVRFLLFIIFMLSIISLFVSLIYLIIRALRRSAIRTVWKRRAAWISGVITSVILALIVAGVGIYGAELLSFMYEPEHVVIRDEAKVVARVVRLTDTTVFYYDYQGPFVMGTEPLYYESYASGVKDPFKDGSAPYED